MSLPTVGKNLFKKNTQLHPYHIVNPSPWPITLSISVLQVLMSFVTFFHYNIVLTGTFVILSLITFLAIMSCWFSDIIDEASFEFQHTKKAQLNLIYGFICFLGSEAMFFFCFFSSFFDVSLSPTIWIGGCWPPIDFMALNPWALPFCNTALLLTSAVTVTMAHRGIVSGTYRLVLFGLIWTCCYGFVFLVCQGVEYSFSPFSIADSVFGSIFYLGTGFHGLHVLMGLLFLLVCLFRHWTYQFAPGHHRGLEFAIWYWHFVDVVWLFLFIFFYWWGMGA